MKWFTDYKTDEKCSSLLENRVPNEVMERILDLIKNWRTTRTTKEKNMLIIKRRGE